MKQQRVLGRAASVGLHWGTEHTVSSHNDYFREDLISFSSERRNSCTQNEVSRLSSEWAQIRGPVQSVKACHKTSVELSPCAAANKKLRGKLAV